MVLISMLGAKLHALTNATSSMKVTDIYAKEKLCRAKSLTKSN